MLTDTHAGDEVLVELASRLVAQMGRRMSSPASEVTNSSSFSAT